MKRVRMEDPRMPTMDDDLQTLIAKSKAAFSRQDVMPTRMAQVRNQEMLPKAQKKEARKPSGLMQRPTRG